MYLVQLLLPLYDNAEARFPQALFAQVSEELVNQFGGMTAYTRAPASGMWQEEGCTPVHDDLVIYEVMTEQPDIEWWRSYRAKLEQRFRQEQLVVRMHEIRLL